MNENTVIVRSSGLTLSKLIWQQFRRQPVGYLEAVLLRNPDLAELGTFIPVGTEIVFPLEITEAKSVQERNVVRLWD